MPGGRSGMLAATMATSSSFGSVYTLVVKLGSLRRRDLDGRSRVQVVVQCAAGMVLSIGG